MTKTVAYLRVSTEKQADKGVSLEAQKAKVQAYASLYDLDLIEVIVDAGISAKTMARPGLQKALAMLKAGTAEALLVVKLDRLTRSVKDLGTLIESCTAQGWALLSVSEQIDTRSAAGRLVLNVLASVAQWEREATGERTAVAMAHLKAEGKYTGGHAPYGWKLSENGKALEVEPDEQSIIIEAKALKAQGLSLRKIGESLTAKGLMPRTGKSWNPKMVQGLLVAEMA